MSLESCRDNPALSGVAPASTARGITDAFDQSGAYFFGIDGGGRFVHANAALARRLGYRPDEIELLALPDVVEGAAGLLARLGRGESLIGVELRFRTRDGELVAVNGMFSPNVEHGRLASALGMFKERGAAAWHRFEPPETADPQLLEALVEFSPDGAAITDSDLEIIAFNRNFLEVWGLDEAAVRAGYGLASAMRIIEDPEAFRDSIYAYHADLESQGSGAVRLIDGRVLDWYTTVAYDRAGAYLGRVWYYRDATGRLRMEDELRRSEELYRQLAMHFPDGAVCLYDQSLTILLADGSGLTDILLSREGIVGRNLSEILPRRLLAMVELAFREALAGRRASQDLRLGGRAFALKTVPISTQPGEPITQAMAIVQDVTQQRRLEEQLRETESRLRALVEQIPAITYIQEVHGRENVTVFMSPQVEAVFGYTPDELLDGSVDWLATIHPDDRERVLSETLASNETGMPFAMEYRSLTKWGNVRWVRDEAAVIRDEHGKVKYWQGIIFDITEERELEEAVRRSEERFRSAFDEAPMGIVMLSLDMALRRVNEAMCAMLGYAEDELIAPDALTGLIDPEDRPALLANLERLRVGDVDRFGQILRMHHREGGTVWTQMDASYIFNGERDPEFILAQFQDISEKHRLEEELRQSEAVFRSMFDHAATGMARLDPDGVWLDANESLCRMLGYTREELLALDFRELIYPEDLEGDLASMASAVRGEQSHYYIEKRVIHRSGAPIWIAVSVSLVRSEDDGRPLFFIIQAQDVTARKDLERKLEFEAHHDRLTGLLNRRGLAQLLDAGGFQDDEQVGILVIDMDGFKDVNDRHGHAAGDLVLQEVARRIKGCVREADHVARLGGDEFVVALDGAVGPQVVARLSERIQSAVSRPIVLPGIGRVIVGASVGTGVGPRRLASTQLLKAADDAMYRAKRQRRSA